MKSPIITIPNEATIKVTKEEMATIFDEWLRRYQANPKEFEDVAESQAGNYGQACARYFFKLSAEALITDFKLESTSLQQP